MRNNFLSLTATALLLLTTASAVSSEQADPTTKIQFTIFLTTQNEDILHTLITDISNPKSPNYGNYVTPLEIKKILRPHHDPTPFYNLLKENGFQIPHNICEDRIDTFRCTMTVQQINDFFQTEMHIFYPNNHIASHPFCLPTYPAIPDLNFVLGIAEHPESTQILAKNRQPPYGQEPAISAESLMSLYNITDPPYNLRGSPHFNPQTQKNTMAVIEFLDDGCYYDQDLIQFATDNDLPQPSATAIHCDPTVAAPDTEGSLDIQFQYATGPHNNGTQLIYYDNQKWLLEFAEELYNTPTSKNPPLISSMSWGWWEQNQQNIVPLINTEQYVKQTNLAFLKNSLLGRTFLASSGDSGSPGRTNPTGEQKPYLRAVYPTSSPWVLSVGGNMYEYNKHLQTGGSTPICQNYTCVLHSTEENCRADNCMWCSGSGVSLYSERPSWTVKDAINYLNYSQHNYYLPPQSEYFSNGRVYPDISLQAHNYLVLIDGEYNFVDGTSCSSPAFSGMLSRINEWLLNNNHPPLGLVGPLLYQMRHECPECFNAKPTHGCSNSTEEGPSPPDAGFCASTSTNTYDAIYGTGTPNFGNMIAYVKSLHEFV